jgi:hypothetical protein
MSVEVLFWFWGAQSSKTWTTLLPFHRWRSSITSNNGKNYGLEMSRFENLVWNVLTFPLEMSRNVRKCQEMSEIWHIGEKLVENFEIRIQTFFLLLLNVCHNGWGWGWFRSVVDTKRLWILRTLSRKIISSGDEGHCFTNRCVYCVCFFFLNYF